MKYVIARYNENVDWAKDLDHFIVQKGEHLENKGREASSYLWYIIENYNNLKGDYIFCQARRSDHPKWDEEPQNESDLQGQPHHSDLRIKDMAGELGIEAPEYIRFRGGAEFKVSAKEIKKRPKEWYKKAYRLANEFPRAPWIYERLWGVIFML